MTEQPDTAKTRTALMVSGILTVSYSTAMTLCDALDDARGARDYWRNRNIDLKRQEAANAALLAGAYEVSRKALDRAEAAEAQIVELDHLAATQAARIAAALAWFADTDCTWAYRVEMARRALTEGTGQ